MLSIVVATLWLGEPVTASLVIAVVLILGGVAVGTTGGDATPRQGRERGGGPEG